jgi:hypothetical protein
VVFDPKDIEEELKKFLEEIAERSPEELMETEYNGPEDMTRVMQSINRVLGSKVGQGQEREEAIKMIEDVPAGFILDMNHSIITRWANSQRYQMVAIAETMAKNSGLSDASKMQVDSILDRDSEEEEDPLPPLLTSFLQHLSLWLQEVLEWQAKHRNKGTG